MPEIDVASEVLNDGIVAATSFVVLRRRSWTDNNGLQRNTVRRVRAIGSVTPSGDGSVDRQDAEQSQNKTLEVITQFFLRAVTSDANDAQWQPDLVLWQQDTFIVWSLDDYSQFGKGFVRATCVSYDFKSQPPLGVRPQIGSMDFRERSNSGLLGAAA